MLAWNSWKLHQVRPDEPGHGEPGHVQQPDLLAVGGRMHQSRAEVALVLAHRATKHHAPGDDVHGVAVPDPGRGHGTSIGGKGRQEGVKRPLKGEVGGAVGLPRPNVFHFAHVCVSLELGPQDKSPCGPILEPVCVSGQLSSTVASSSLTRSMVHATLSCGMKLKSTIMTCSPESLSVTKEDRSPGNSRHSAEEMSEARS